MTNLINTVALAESKGWELVSYVQMGESAHSVCFTGREYAVHRVTDCGANGLAFESGDYCKTLEQAVKVMGKRDYYVRLNAVYA